MENNFTTLDEILQGKTTIGISGHIHPDGDCAGSTLAVYNYIRDYYPEIQVRIFLEAVPEKFSFLKRSEEVITDYPDQQPFDLFLMLDCSTPDRLGNAGKYLESAKKKACIDHHLTNDCRADFLYVFPQSSSASELVFELMNKDRITREIAECLYLGIIHDTGIFQYSCTSAKTMAAGGFLMETGIDYPGICDRTFYAKSYTQTRITGQAMADCQMTPDGRVIYEMLTLDQMHAYGASSLDLDGIVQQLRLTQGPEIALFLYEKEKDVWKGSLRVNSDANVAAIAAAFGGGGHKKAAGFTVSGTREEALDKVLTEIRRQLGQAETAM